jgi:hypothetical protein
VAIPTLSAAGTQAGWSSEEVQNLITFELSTWQADLQPLWQEWDQMWSKWQIEPVDPTTNPYLSKVQVPYGMHAVEIIQSRIVGDKIAIDYQAIDEDSDDLIATLNGKVASYQLKRMAFDMTAKKFIRQALVTNYSIAKVGWVRVERVEEYTDTEHHAVSDDHPLVGTVEVMVPRARIQRVRNEPFVELVNVKDFVWPISAASLDDAVAVWQRSWPLLKDVQDKGSRGVYQNTDDVKASADGRWQDAYGPQFSSQGLTPTGSATGDQDDPNGRVEVWERWEDDRLTVIANPFAGPVLLRDEPNPFIHKRKPYIDYTPVERPFQMHGLGTMRMVNDSNEHLNTLMRQICDAGTFSLNPAWKLTEGVDADNFVLSPGAMLKVPDTEDIQPLITPTADFAAGMQIREALLEDMQRTSGVFELIGGAFGFQGSRTATGMTQIIQEGARRITEMSDVFAHRSVRRLAYLMLSMNAQYLDENIILDLSDDPEAQAAWNQLVEAEEAPVSIADRVKGMLGRAKAKPMQISPNGRATVTPEMLAAKGRLEPIPLTGQDKTTMEQQDKSDATQALQSIAPILASPQNPLDMAALADWALKKMGMPEQDRKKVIKTPPPQQLAQVTDAMGGPPSDSGPSGEPLPSGGVVGAPGAAGPAGPPGMAAAR